MSELEKYRIGAVHSIENDGYIGIPAEITLYFDREKRKAVSGYRSTYIILYVIGANIERIGTEKDGKIILSMLERGYAVAVLDYLGNSKACPPALDWSVQGIRNDLINGQYADGEVFLKEKYYNTLVAPSGYDVSLENVYWSIDRHGADGTLEKIVEIWNNDFRSVKGESVIKWAENGVRKPTQTAFDGSEPIWLDRNGSPDENGEYIKLKCTKADKITDCVRTDGESVELDLYMHLIYPVKPKKCVPVMCLASSSEHLVKGSATLDRPHHNGFLFNGYAAVMYDYGYTPMARNDHYGYFDGNKAVGHITGDNVTYSIQFYNDKLINTAAMRYVRYLALSDERFAFDIGKIGVFGNSKGGWMAYLGEDHPENIPPLRMFPGHHGETRYDNGKTEKDGIIRGGEPQPWLTYNGESIDSGADFIYASCGGTVENITRGHAPTFISCNQNDNFSSFRGTSNQFVNVCRSMDVRAMWFEIELGHTLAHGTDYYYGVDTYKAFFDFAGYWLKNDAVKVCYTAYENGSITIKFTGAVASSEITAVTCVSADGKTAEGFFSSFFGGTEWRFTPCNALVGEEYTLTVPASLVGDNGKPLGSDVCFKFTVDSLLKPVKKGASKHVRDIPLEDFVPDKYANIVIDRTPDGEKALKVESLMTNTVFLSEEFYSNPVILFRTDKAIKEGALSEADLGRRFKISFRIYDTASRYVQVFLNSCNSKELNTVDYQYSYHNLVTKANEWTEFSFDYTVYEPTFGEAGLKEKVMTFKAFCEGDKHTPIYFSGFTVTEMI